MADLLSSNATTQHTTDAGRKLVSILFDFTVSELTALATKASGGKLGFDPRRDDRTRSKTALADFAATQLMAAGVECYEPSIREYLANPDYTGPETTAPAIEPAQVNTPAPRNTSTAPAANDDATQLAAIIARLTNKPSAAPIDADAVKAIALEAVTAALAGITAPLVVEVRRHEAPAITIKTAHAQLPFLLQLCTGRLNPWLVGPPGTGKTTAAAQVAEALGLKFYSSGAVDSAHALIGYTDAQSRVVMTAFRHAWTHGGVFCLDEGDSCHPAAILAINNALANGCITFPGDVEQTPRHADTIIIIGANTDGKGGTLGHARVKLDDSTRDRFIFVDWDLDDALETAIATNHDWLARVRCARVWIKAQQIKGANVTPRAVLYGATMLKQGCSLANADRGTWGRDLTPDQRAACAKTLPRMAA